jgi:exportin-1
MKTNVAACTSIGAYFYPQIGKIFRDMLSMYRVSSTSIDDAVKAEGKHKKMILLFVSNMARSHSN